MQQSDDAPWLSSGGRCDRGRLLRSVETERVHSETRGADADVADAADVRLASSATASFDLDADPSKVLAAWQRWDPDCLDPDELLSVDEYFPLGPTRRQSVSFVRGRFKEADDIGDEFILTRGTSATSCCEAEPHDSSSSSSSSSDNGSGDCCSGWQFWRPAPLPQRWLPPISEGILGPLLPAAVSEYLPLQLSGIRIVEGTRALPEHCSLPGLRESLSGKDAAAASQGGFLESAPWSLATRVTRVEEHCRDAQLGLWGWIFRLKHSVLAVHIETQCSIGGDNNGTPPSPHRDLLYLDKNADIGVSWRRAGFREYFNEAPRDGYSLATDLPLQTFWKTVLRTKAFEETQERSNCQHFVKEVLGEVASMGGQPEEASKSPLELRNQGVANVLQSWGYLDEDCKPTEDSVTGRQVLMGQAWRLFMSWDCKAGATRFFTPWMERIPVTAATTSQ